MTEDERTALVDELAEAMCNVPQIEQTFHGMATACLPIIEKLLTAHDEVMIGNAYNKGYRDAVAAHDLDGLLDSSRVIQTLVMDGLDGGYEADIAVGRGADSAGGYDKYRATGNTFTEAIRNAVAQAQGRGECDDDTSAHLRLVNEANNRHNAEHPEKPLPTLENDGFVANHWPGHPRP